MQAVAGDGRFKTSGAGGADIISKDRVPQCCCFWGETWGDAWGERGPAQLSWRLWVRRWGDLLWLGLWPEHQEDACLPLKYTSLGKLPGKNSATVLKQKNPKTTNHQKHQTKKKPQKIPNKTNQSFAEMIPGLSDSELLHWSARFPNDPACFSLVVAGWDLQWMLFYHPQMCTSSSWIFLLGTCWDQSNRSSGSAYRVKKEICREGQGFLFISTSVFFT